MKQGFRENVPLDEAVDSLLDLVSAVASREVDLDDSVGRVAACPVEAERPMPHYDRAAMDGYAVKAEDTHEATETKPVSLDVVVDEVGAGEARYIHTGSEVPDGATAVVRVERTTEVGDTVEVESTLSRGENVAYAGEDVDTGEAVVERGTRIGPSTQAVMRSVGVETVEVRRKPEVAVVPTGDEVVQGNPEPGEVVGTNGWMVAEYVHRWGGDAELYDIVPDDTDRLESTLLEATSDADLAVTIGGSSVGERDLLPKVVDTVGDMEVHGVAIKPGHPVGFGEVDDTAVLTLPGYPVSCVVNSYELLRPAVHGLLGVDGEPQAKARAVLQEKVASEVGKRTYTRVVLDEEDGKLAACPLRTKGAGVLSSVSRCDGFLVTPESREGYSAGEEVDVELWRA